MKLPPSFSLTAYTASWVALLGLTTVTFKLGTHAPSPLLMAVVLAFTLIKGQLVVNYFMGLRRVRLLWRLVMAAYLVGVGGLIALAYLTA